MTEPCVVTGLCRDCKYTDCVTVCPVEPFFQDEFQLYIAPDDVVSGGCIDCKACIPECPVEAIFHVSEVPSQYRESIDLNREKAVELSAGDGGITSKQDAKRGTGCVDPNH